MSKEDGLRDLICPNGCGGMEFMVSCAAFSIKHIREQTLKTCFRCGFTFAIWSDTDSYDQQREDMKLVNRDSGEVVRDLTCFVNGKLETFKIKLISGDERRPGARWEPYEGE